MPAPKKEVSLLDKTKTDMQLYWRLTNWTELWEKWYLSIDKSGSYTYRTIKQFAAEVRESPAQYEFLLWYLGPEIEEDPRIEKYSFAIDKATDTVHALDWKHKRDTGGWFTEAAAKLVTKKAAAADDSLNALKQIGADTVLPFVYQIRKLVDKTHEAFKGEMALDCNTAEENMQRANAYIGQLDKLFGLLQKAIGLQALTLGVNFADMGSFAQLVAGVQMYRASAGITNKLSRAEECMNEMLKATIIKAKSYDLELPSGMTDVIEAVAEKDDEPKKPKPN